MNEVVRFPARLQLLTPARADKPLLAGFERALPAPLERFRELCGSDELTPDERIELARSGGAALMQIALLSFHPTI